MTEFIVVILVCAVATAVPECSRDTATDILGSQPVANPIACMKGGEMAGARFGVEHDHYLKVVCERRKTSG